MSRPGLPPDVPDPPPDLGRRLRFAIALCVAVVAIASLLSLLTAGDEDLTDEESAALALFSGLGDDETEDQQAKAEDSSAKSDARNLVTQIESCYAETADYAQCGEPRLEAEATGIDLDDVTIDAGTGTYAVETTSESGNTFRIAKTEGGALERTCTSADDDGGCDGGTW